MAWAVTATIWQVPPKKPPLVFLQMKNHTIAAVLFSTAACVLLGSLTALAQPGSGGPSPTAVPIDGGASLLLAGGVALGLKKLRERRRARQSNQ